MLNKAHDYYVSVSKVVNKLLEFAKRYPIPAFTISGLFVGTLFHWPLNQSSLGQWIWLITLIGGGAPIVWDTFRGMLQKHFASDIVAMMAIVAAILLNYALPGVVIVIMQSGGKALEDYAFRRASSSLDVLLARSPRIARRRKRDSIEEINVSDIHIGDLLVVRPGDLVPVDGKVIRGQAQIDESSLTGEPLSKSKKIGDNVFSGTINAGDAFEMHADKISEESQYAKIVKLVRKAQQEKAPIQRIADRYAVWFTPIVLVVSVIGWVITSFNLQTILSVLVVATPCSLIFATPIAIMSGINRAAKMGIIIKSGASIEQIGKAQVVVFDKTGTITFGTPAVEEIIPFDSSSNNDTNRDDILRKAASVEQLSSHPAAQALIQKAEERKLGKLPIPTNFHEVAGAGVEGDINGEHVVIGSKSLFESIENENNRHDNDDDKQYIKNAVDAKKRLIHYDEGKMLAFISINDNPAGAIVFGDEIRPKVGLMLQSLRNLGVKQTVMLTGDSSDNAQKIAQQTGITHFESDLLPEQKVKSVKKLKEQYKNIVMVGDGINDAPALAAATVGIAMGAHGTAISAEAADIVLLVDDVTRVVDALEIGQRTLSIAKQSIYIGLGASFIFMVIASFGFIPPTLGALLQEVFDVAVILNALRAR
ncbi:MAG: heavy metal translocating P-type ATPase [Thermoproteota archaeon]|nr:heavy metal translocating P-type ATPase [Thermoproteota archaeon]